MTDDISVHDSEGEYVESQLIPITDAYLKLRSYHVKAYLGRNAGEAPKYWLVFSVSVPALGFSTYSISRAQGKGSDNVHAKHFHLLAGKKANFQYRTTSVKILSPVIDLAWGNIYWYRSKTPKIP